MKKRIGFLEYVREAAAVRPVKERINDNKEIFIPFSNKQAIEQASRCMDCGVPFCESACPTGSSISEWILLAEQGKLEEAFEILQSQINFPEFTSRVCQAHCEMSCVLSINQLPVTIKNLEYYVIELAFTERWIRPRPPISRTGKKVAIVGSGPTGLTSADELNKKGHIVTVYERKDRIGGMLRYGIPDCRLEKWVLDRRIALMEAEGVKFRTNCNIGHNVAISELEQNFDVIILCGGSTVSRDIPLPGRNLKGIVLVMEYLEYMNRKIAGEDTSFYQKHLSAKDKNVCILSGKVAGWIGAIQREFPKSVNVFELLSKPPMERDITTWPLWPFTFMSSPFYSEGDLNMEWAVLTKRFIGDNKGNLKGVKTVNIEWTKDINTGRHSFKEIPGTERIVPAELAIISLGSVHPDFSGELGSIGLELTDRNNVKAFNYQTNIENIFVAGDMRRGQSEVIWAIKEGKEAADAVNTYLMYN